MIIEKKKKAIIYIRKSTDEKDKQQQSIGTQLDWCEEFTEKNKDKYEIIETYIEKESAKARGRKFFNEMIEKIENKEAEVIISMYIDRISRNPYDNGRVQGLLQEQVITEIVTSTRIYTYGDSGLIFSIESGFANEYLLKLKKGVRDGLKTKIESGGYYSQAPLGYINNKLEKTIEIDIERSFYIPEIYKLRLEGFSYKAIQDIIYERGLRSKKGFKVSERTIERILHNPFYYGYFVYNGDLFSKGELYKGNHQPIISYDLFQQVQSINRGVVYKSNSAETPLRGKVFHFETGKMLNPALVKKKFIYFQIKTKEGQLWFPQSEIIKYFDKNIHLYIIPEEHKEEVKNVVKEEYFKQIEDFSKKIAILKSQKTKKENEKNNLIFLRSNFEITGEEFIFLKNKIMEEIINFEKEIENLSIKNDENLQNFNTLFELLFFALNNWKTYDNEIKLKIINELVFELHFDNKKRLYIQEKPLYKTLKSLNFVKWSEGRGLNSHTQGLKP